MTRAEVLEFLELPDSATDDDIRVRMNDKLSYFQRLSENAPNDFLRKLHTSNTEKIRTLQREMGGTTAAPASSAARYEAPSYQQPAQQAPARSSEVAWLVRHTERQSAITFPLFYGKNYIGRNPSSSNGPGIAFAEDPYVSRVHALLEVININPLQIVVSDDANSNGGKASKNGTYINGDEKRLSRKVTIGANDTIQIGMTKFIIRLNNTSIHKIVQEVEESDFMKTVVIDIF
jgi:hypothetical protein